MERLFWPKLALVFSFLLLVGAVLFFLLPDGCGDCWRHRPQRERRDRDDENLVGGLHGSASDPSDVGNGDDSKESDGSPGFRAPSQRRFGIQRDNRGLCDHQDYQEIKKRREDMLRRFERRGGTECDVRHDIGVGPATVAAACEALTKAPAAIRELAGIDAAQPEVFVYLDAPQLQSAACVNSETSAYYDGAIHVASSESMDQVRKSIVHEFVHHALLFQGIHRPAWLQEGLAMHAAREAWWKDPRLGLVKWLQQDQLPFDAMVDDFAYAADEADVRRMYYQSWAMVHVVLARKGEAGVAELVSQLRSGSLTAEEAFVAGFGVSERDLVTAFRFFLPQGAYLR